MSVAAMVSPTTPSSMDNAMLAKLDTRPAYESTQRTSAYSLDESIPRRGSVESRSISNGFEGMRLNNGSPYHSNNQSTTSIQSSLLQQRTPATPAERLSASRFPNSYQPNTIRFSGEGPKHARTAPPITSPPVSSIANALEPEKGQAWAFPDSREPPSRQTSYIDSRRSSIADSLASSQYTDNSRLPQGQRRLDEAYPGEFNRLSRASSEFQGASHHHHSLQHKQIGDLRDDEAGSPGSGQPYSRTPELRVSHKLAERKRRNEMKELYDELRDLMPQERGSKASKWEILSKGRPNVSSHMFVANTPQLSKNTSVNQITFTNCKSTVATLPARLHVTVMKSLIFAIKTGTYVADQRACQCISHLLLLPHSIFLRGLHR